MHPSVSMTIGRSRRDGKIPVRITYPGLPNAFGGFYPSRSYNKLYTQVQIDEYLNNILTEDVFKIEVTRVSHNPHKHRGV